jgi:hypothetical protein
MFHVEYRPQKAKIPPTQINTKCAAFYMIDTSDMGNRPVLKLLTLAEIARRLDACDKTVRRAVAKAGIQGEAILCEGKTITPLFSEARLTEIKQLITGK